jgi:hypothetical protein
MPSTCPHSFDDLETSVYAEGLCPLCLCAKLERYRIAFSWMEDQDPQLVQAARDKFFDGQ